MATDRSCCSHGPGPRAGTQGCLFSDGTGGDALRPSWGQRRGHHHGPGERKGSASGSRATAACRACGRRCWPVVAGVGAHCCQHASMTVLPFQLHLPALATALPASTPWNSVSGSDRGVSEAPLPPQRLESVVRWAPRLPPSEGTWCHEPVASRLKITPRSYALSMLLALFAHRTWPQEGSGSLWLPSGQGPWQRESIPLPDRSAALLRSLPAGAAGFR